MFKYTVNMDTFTERIKQGCPATAERRITTEQILQLCRILAEQSKNKSPELSGDPNERGSPKEIQSDDITSSRSCGYEFCDRLSAGPEESPETQQPVVLGSNNASKYLSASMGRAKQAKKDILNKIRNQIFERKRQKLATLQRSAGGVWRPW